MTDKKNSSHNHIIFFDFDYFNRFFSFSLPYSCHVILSFFIYVHDSVIINSNIIKNVLFFLLWYNLKRMNIKSALRNISVLILALLFCSCYFEINFGEKDDFLIPDWLMGEWKAVNTLNPGSLEELYFFISDESIVITDINGESHTLADRSNINSTYIDNERFYIHTFDSNENVYLFILNDNGSVNFYHSYSDDYLMLERVVK